MSPNGNNSVTLNNCLIKKISIGNDRNLNLNLSNCWIGEFELQERSVRTLSAKGGGIIKIVCPAPDQSNPFTGSITFQDVYFPISKKHSTLFKGAQQYRNLRAHLEALQNSPTASLMRAKELASEYEDDKGLSKIFSRLYFFVSDYGQKPGRPLWFLFGVYIVMALITLIAGGDFGKSLALPFQNMIYPVGILRDHQGFSTATWFTQLLLLFLALTADGLIIFVISGLRKRFKLN